MKKILAVALATASMCAFSDVSVLTTQSDNSAITITNLTDSRIQIFLNEVEYITEIDSGLLIPCFEGDTTILRIETENHSLTCPSDTQLNQEVIK